MNSDEALVAVLGQGANQVIKLTHPWLNVLAQNLAGKPALVVELPHPPGYFIDGGKGFSVEIGSGNAALPHFIRIASYEAEVSPAFAALTRHLLEQSSRALDFDSSVSAFYDALEEFREFLSRPRRALGEDAIRGLMAELLILESILEPGEDPESALRSWNGPFGNSKDFIFPSGHCVEVKSARRPTMHVTISSLQQLEAPNVTLQLAVVPLERAQPASPQARSLLDVVASIEAFIDHRPPARKLWAVALDTIGFDVSDPFYEPWWFVLGDTLAFDVTSNFPRIESSSVPKGITAVTYHLNVSELEPFAATLKLN
ncbi:PD-(D/E)XK motif protein [Herbiconiux sp. CPCC 205716]|uniref:PD-(D/E)XK motif protein n=1 Tax=Herbiconiux gentiana TaxID=2970912 RepID=A0ABT2GBI1_9MICO|nr:PD-(D/E)XK motif protein [Herbiconiux gentiana]MCS5713525.1 PD-(D/E)XK motif protein [Herbiconiux gentiana]